MVRVVCFDVGGVLIRITHHWRTAAESAGVAIGKSISDLAQLQDAPQFEAYQRGEIDDDEYLTMLGAYLGHISKEDAMLVHNQIMVEPYQGVDRLVDALNHLGIATGCLSNTNAPHWHDMFHSGRFPANEALRIRVASHELGLEKPDERIFRRFEEASSAVGDQIVYFDDSPLNIRATATLGWRSFLVDPSHSTVEQMATFLVKQGIPLKIS